MNRESFLYGAMILLAASFVNRIIGFVYQILTIRLINPEGVGLFNMVFPIYILLLVIASAGIPVAIAKLVAEEIARNNPAGAHRIFKISFGLIFISCCSITVMTLIALPALQKYVFANPEAYHCFLCLIPGIVIVSLCSAFRGFFQGLQQMKPTALTQTAEQMVRVTIGLSFAYLLLPWGIEYAAVGISLGVVMGELTGFIYMLIIYLQNRLEVTDHSKAPVERSRETLRKIFELAVPVTMTRFVATALMSIDAILIPQRLQAAGHSLSQATSIYGQFIGIAEALWTTPSMVTISLATVLIPTVSSAVASNNWKTVYNRIDEALRFTMLAGLPATALFLMMPEDLCDVLFGYREAGTALAVLAIGGPFMYFQQTVTGILQGLGRAEKPFKNMVIASLFKILGIFFLTSMPQLGIHGTALAMVMFSMIMAWLNYLDLRNLTGYRMEIRSTILKPLMATAIMTSTIWYARSFIAANWGINLLSVSGLLLMGGIVYLISLFATGGITAEDLQKFKTIKK